jgi:hypothetical protein
MLCGEEGDAVFTLALISRKTENLVEEVSPEPSVAVIR